MKMKHSKLWYVAADAGRATAYIRSTHGNGYHAVGNWTSELTLPADERPRFTDRPGRAFDGRDSTARHAQETTSPAELAKQAFGRGLAGTLNRARSDGAFEHLILFSAPRFLHELRSHFDQATAAAVIHSEAKDLTKIPAEKLYEIFDAVTALAGT